MGVPKVPHSDFVVAWVTSDNMDDVIKATNMSKDAIRARVKSLRARGVRLADLPNVMGAEREAKDLNKLVDRYSRKDSHGHIQI